MAQTATDWHGALADYGRALLDFENHYEDAGHAARSLAYRLPANLGPMPDELIEVASRLLQRSNEIERRVQTDLDTVGAERAALTRAKKTWVRSRPAARFVDVRG